MFFGNLYSIVVTEEMFKMYCACNTAPKIACR